MKKCLSILLCVMMVMLLLLNVGCGASSTESAVSDSTKAAVDQEKTEEAKSEEVKEDTFRLLSWYSEDAMKTTLEGFAEKYPNIKVEFQFAPPSKPYLDLLKTQLTAGEGPDVYVIGGEWKDFVKPGYVMELTGQPFLQNYTEYGLSATNLDGKQYGVNIDSWMSGIFINKTVCDKAGVKYPFNTYDEFIAGLETLKKAGIKPLSVPGGNKDRDVWRIPFCKLISDFYSDPNNKNFDKEVFEGNRKFSDFTPTVQKWYDTMVKTGYYTKDMLGMSADQVINEFVTGKCGMIYGGHWMIADIKKANPDIQAVLVPFPGEKPGQDYIMGGPAMSWAINSNTEHKDAALKWLEYMSTADGWLRFQKSTSCGGFLKDVKYELDPMLDGIMPAMEAGRIFHPWPKWEGADALLNIVFSKFQDILAGVAKPEDLGNAMDKKVEEVMKK